jgi:hypothetical protein
VLDHAGNTKDFDGIHGSVAPNSLANLFSVDIRQHDVEDNHVRPEFFDLHSRVKAVVGGSDIESAISGKRVVHEVDQILVVIDDQQFLLAAFQGIGRDTVVFHEDKQLIAGNSSKPASWNAESFQRPIIKTTDNRLLANLADLGSLAGSENRFCVRHSGIILPECSLPSRRRVAKLARSVYPLRLAAPAEFTEPAVAGAEDIEAAEIRSRWISKEVVLVSLLFCVARATKPNIAIEEQK